LSGTSDIYRNNQIYLLVSENKWNPRPVFQSLNIYNTKLSKFNQEHLLNGYTAPDNIFYRMETIDMRFPTLDDGLSLPIILNNYDLIDEYKDYLIFRKKKNIPKFSIEDNLIFSSSTNIGDEINISSYNEPLYIKINSDISLFGKFILILYKITPLFINVTTNNGTTYTYKLYTSVSKDGIILSPLIINNPSLKSFIDLLSNINPIYNIKSFSLSTEINQMKDFYLSKFIKIFYKQSFTYSLYSLKALSQTSFENTVDDDDNPTILMPSEKPL
jgi:hypothetical protein